VFTRRAFWGALRVYARKRIDVMPDARIAKLLIQSAFTSPNGDFGPVLLAASHLGVTCHLTSDAVGGVLFLQVGTEARGSPGRSKAASEERPAGLG